MPITASYSDVYGITVSNSTVYTAGMYYDLGSGIEKACYWKGTACTDLNVPGTAAGSLALEITMVNGTLYTAGGYYDPTSGTTKVCYWTGTARTDLYTVGEDADIECCFIAVK